jgi:hypothetical protein
LINVVGYKEFGVIVIRHPIRISNWIYIFARLGNLTSNITPHLAMTEKSGHANFPGHPVCSGQYLRQLRNRSAFGFNQRTRRGHVVVRLGESIFSHCEYKIKTNTISKRQIMKMFWISTQKVKLSV